MALIVALIGPIFVDWTSYRAAFEREASLALGQPVRVLGSADMQILPLPHLQFETVHVGADEKSPILVVDEFDIRIELMPLIQGKIDVVDMTLRAPRLKIALDEKGHFSWRSDNIEARDLDLEKIRLNDVRIEDGSVQFFDASTGQKTRLDNVNGNLSARTLIGPYKIESTFLFDGEPYSLALSSGSAGDSGVRLKSLLTPANHPVTLSVDGMLAREDDGRLHYVGKSIMNNQIDGVAGAGLPWELNADSDFSASALVLNRFEFQHGNSEQAYRLEGKGKLDLAGEPRFDLALASRQLDLDRALGSGPNAPVDLQTAVDHLIDGLAELPVSPIKGDVKFDVPGVILGGGILRNLEIQAQLVENGWRFDQLEADLPGYSFVSMKGLFSRRSIADMPAHAFEGEVRLRSDQPDAFAKWWLKDIPVRGRLEPFDFSAQLTTRPERLTLDRIDLDLAGNRAAGRLDWFTGNGSNPSSLALQLKAERLDLDNLQGVTSLVMQRPGGETQSADQPSDASSGLGEVAIDIVADQLVTNSVEGRGLAAQLRFNQGSLEIDKLSLQEFAGARIEAEGDLQNLSGDARGRLEGRLSASSLAGLSDLMVRLAPEWGLSNWFSNAHTALAPADITFSVEGQGGQNGLSLKLGGDVGGGKADIAARLAGALADWQKEPLAISVALQNPDGAKLLHLTGLDLNLISLPPLEAKLKLDGRLADRATTLLSLTSGKESAGFEGYLSYQDVKGLAASGKLSAQVSDLEPYLLATGLPLASPGEALPVDIGADFDLKDGKASFASISGHWNDQPVSGDLAYEANVTQRLIKGQLDLGDLDGIWLGETIMGPGRLTSVGKDWLDQAFVSPQIETELLQLNLDLEIQARSLELAAPFIFQQPAFSLRWQESELVVSDFDALLAGGRMAGSLQLGNLEGEAILRSHFKLAGANVAPFVWQRDERPVAIGQIDLSANLESQGRSLAGIMSGLSGNGTFEMRDGVVRYLNETAFEQVVRAVDAGLELKEDEISRTFMSHMDAGSTEISRLAGAFRVAGGALRANNIESEAEILQSRGNLVLDLAAQTLQGDWSIKVEPAEEDAVTGAVPEVGLIFNGDLADPVRTVDVAPFTGYLSIRAFEKEVERVENLQADILEKERMRRLLKLYRQKEKRLEEEKKAEELRIQQEAERQAAEEATRIEAEKIAKEQAAREKAQREKEAKERAALEKAAAEKAAREKAAAEKAAKEQAAKEKAAAEQAAREKAAAEKKAAEEAERQRQLEAEKLRQQEEAARKAAEEEAARKKAEEEQSRGVLQPLTDGIEVRPLQDLTNSISGTSTSEDNGLQPLPGLPDQLLQLPRRPSAITSSPSLVPDPNEKPSYDLLIERLRQSPDRIIQLD